jgi:tetratricopeptide (TPR) repeat protein
MGGEQTMVGAGSDLLGVIDLVMEAVAWRGEDLGARYDVIPVNECIDLVDDALKAKATEYHEKLFEHAVEQDDEVLMQCLEGEMPDVPTLTRLIRKTTVNMDMVPVLTGTALKNNDVQPLLDAVVDYIPSPLETIASDGVTEEGDPTMRRSSDVEPLSALALKMANDPCVGTPTFSRDSSGVVEAGTTFCNSVKGMVLVGLKDTTAGNPTAGETLCTKKNAVIHEKMDFPEPVIQVAAKVLIRLAGEDPSFRFSRDEETGQTAIEEMGELHLEIIVDRITREFGVERNVGAPQVTYREAITATAEIAYIHKRLARDSGQYARVRIIFEPKHFSEKEGKTNKAEIRRNRLGLDDVAVAETLYSMGYTLHNNDEAECALVCFEESLSIRRYQLGEDSKEVGDVLNIVSETPNVHREKHRPELAVECYEECLRIRRTTLGTDHENVTDALIAVNDAESDMQHTGDEMRSYQVSLKIRTLVLGEHDESVAAVLQFLGTLKFRANNHSKARELLSEFVRIRRNNCSHNDRHYDRHYVTVLFMLGNIHKMAGQEAEARLCWSEAYQVFQELGLADTNPIILMQLMLGSQSGCQTYLISEGGFNMSTSGGAIALLSLSSELVAVDIIFNTIKTSFVNDNGTAGEKSTMIKNPDLMMAQCLYPGPSLPIVLHRIVNMPLSRSTDHSRFVNGIVLDHGACHPDMPDVLPNCEIMTLNTSLEYEKTETQSGFFLCDSRRTREVGRQ